MAFGGEIRRAYNNNIAENMGSFTYPTMTDFLADEATDFTVLLGAGNDRILQPSSAYLPRTASNGNPTSPSISACATNGIPRPPRPGAVSRILTSQPAHFSPAPALHTNNKNFEPRIGFAWDPFKDGKTSVRAAYAILTQDPTTNIVSPLSGNPLLAFPVSVSSAANAITLENLRLRPRASAWVPAR